MEVTVAKSAGFCFGVKRAVDTVYREIESGEKPVYTFGPIIHNEQVVEDLENRGVQVIHSEDELEGLSGGTVVIRSHGVSRDVCEKIEARGMKIVDATCPFVKKIHRIVDEEGRKGRHVVIIGSADHPEVQGIMGWASGPVTVMHTAEEAESFVPENGKPISIVAQTTFNYNKFKDLVEIFLKKSYDSTVLKTICNATEERQTEARAIARKVDAMFVVGGRHSSNTQKLYEICKEECKNTYFIETLVDLESKPFQSFGRVGITAGASTPNKIIEEVQKMSEMSFEQMLDETFKTIHNGEVLEGKVISVRPDEAVLNIGYKADGILTSNEYSNTPVDLTTVISVGDELTVKVLKVNDGEGQVALSYKKLAAEKANKRIEEAFENKEVLKAPVVQILKGGLSVDVEGGRVFIPASLVSDAFERDLDKYLNQEIEFVVTEFNPKKRRIIGDRKQLIVAEKEAAKKALFEKIEVGQTVTGVVKSVVDFGAFIDIGGADGLLHISEMSWGRVGNPRKLFKPGDEVTAFIKEINGDKIALSLKFEDTNPWANASEKFAVGVVVTGKVARMTDFGAFVEIEPGVDALLHVSQIANHHVDKPSDELTIGQEIEAKIVDFNEEEKKISLSMKALLNDSDEAEEVVADTEE